jgi:hypothetical protein
VPIWDREVPFVDKIWESVAQQQQGAGKTEGDKLEFYGYGTSIQFISQPTIG